MAERSYFRDLLARLTEGFSRLEARTRRRHADYLLKMQRPDGGWGGRSGQSDDYYTDFALRTLLLLDALSREAAVRAGQFLGGVRPIRTLDQLYSRLSCRLSLKVYGEGQAPYDPAPSATLRPQEAAPPKSELDGESAAETLKRFRNEDGGFRRREKPAPSSTYQTFLGMLCLELLGLPLGSAERLAGWLLLRRRPDGGFVEADAASRSGTNPTAAALAILWRLGRLEARMGDPAAEFLATMQTEAGGLRASAAAPAPDLLSTCAGITILTQLEQSQRLDREAAARFVAALECHDGGFVSGHWQEQPDVEYTFYGLGTLALSGFRQESEN